MPRSRFLVAVGCLFAATLSAPSAPSAPSANDPKALVVVDRAISRMGGEAVLRSVSSARLDLMTQWQRTSFADHPYADAPSFERAVSLFDYRSNSWRNTRTFLPGTNGSVDIVRDTIGARTNAGPNGSIAMTPLNIAYVDERRELFAFAPERTLLAARDAGGLRLLADTAIAGVAHARVSTTVDGFPATWFLRRTDGLPSMVRFRADETNDFGLAPWGMQEVEIWWSGWARVAPGVMVPRQRDVRRVGRPYKRMTVMAITLNAPAPADSFSIADSTARAFVAGERRPMWAAPLDSARIVERDFATFPPFFGSTGAVRIGGVWVLLETAQAAGAVDLLSAWLGKQEAGARVGAGLVTSVSTSNGGARWFADHHVPYFVAPGAVPMLRQILGAQPGSRGATIIAGDRWVKVGTDSLWIERVDSPDANGALMVYSPTLRWLYAPMLVARPAAQPEFDAALAKLKSRGLPVEWLGGARGIRTAAPR
jgi:hypothetical protein